MKIELLGRVVAQCLQAELDTTPKPGLVDRRNTGSHRDMDYVLMCKSIETLRPYFDKMAAAVISPDVDMSLIQSLGIEAEKAMLKATNGVNTHKGAIFALGLVVVAYQSLVNPSLINSSFDNNRLNDSELLSGNRVIKLSSSLLSEKVADLAAYFSPCNDTKGGDVVKRYKLNGALANAQDGYKVVFTTILPFYRQLKQSGIDNNEINLRTLLYIMCCIDDTNIYHRGGAEVALEVKLRARMLLNDFSFMAAEQFDDFCISQNVSAGGSADMLSLTILLDQLTDS